MSFLRLLIPASIACLCNALANMLWKMQFDKKPISRDAFSSFRSFVDFFLTPNIIGGVLLYIGSMLLFFYMLSNFKLSQVIPITVLTYVFNIVIAVAVFHERLVLPQIIGTVIIMCGLFVLSRA